MWGYRTPVYIDLGRAAARAADAANLAPARLTALAIIAAAVPEGRAAPALRIWWRDRSKTSSPNAGQPMAAMAGATGVELTKRDHDTPFYALGAGLPPPSPADLRRGIRFARRASLLAAGLALTGIYWRPS